jgi:hypothetical protein
VRLLPLLEDTVKGAVWDCRMCGQCVLHSTGWTCPMTCPKTLRNGPCGGVREDGHCEVKPEMRCIWTKAEKRSHHALNPGFWAKHFAELRPPVDNQLRGTASWANLFSGRDHEYPDGWSGLTHDDEPAPPWPGLGEIDDVSALDAGFHVRNAIA